MCTGHACVANRHEEVKYSANTSINTGLYNCFGPTSWSSVNNTWSQGTEIFAYVPCASLFCLTQIQTTWTTMLLGCEVYASGHNCSLQCYSSGCTGLQFSALLVFESRKTPFGIFLSKTLKSFQSQFYSFVGKETISVPSFSICGHFINSLWLCLYWFINLSSL